MINPTKGGFFFCRVLHHGLRGVNRVVILALFASFYTCGFIADQTLTVNQHFSYLFFPYNRFLMIGPRLALNIGSPASTFQVLPLFAMNLVSVVLGIKSRALCIQDKHYSLSYIPRHVEWRQKEKKETQVTLTGRWRWWLVWRQCTAALLACTERAVFCKGKRTQHLSYPLAAEYQCLWQMTSIILNSANFVLKDRRVWIRMATREPEAHFVII